MEAQMDQPLLAATPPQTPIEKWLDQLPADATDFSSASLPPVWTAEVWHSLLSWIQHRVESVSAALEAEEYKYRRLGLQYHRVPRQLRITPTQPNSIAMNRIVLKRLSEIFETNRQRSSQDFFNSWHRFSAAIELTQDKLRNAEEITDTAELEKIYGYCEAGLRRARKLLFEIQTGIRAVEMMLNEILARLEHLQMEDTVADLGEKNGVEGSLFRCWISSFPEIVAEEQGKSGILVEEIAERYWHGGGIPKSAQPVEIEKKSPRKQAEEMGEGWRLLGEEMERLRMRKKDDDHEDEY